MVKKKLLINFVYCRPVGHVVEAIKFAKGFFEANKDIEIHLILNKKSPYEIADKCPWIKKVYAADTADILKKGKNSNFFKKIQKNWDYILADYRAFYESNWEVDLGIFHVICNSIFNFKYYYGNIWDKKNYPNNLKYKLDSKVVLSLPKESIDFSKRFNYKGLKICVMLAGSADKKQYPFIDSWIKLFKKIKLNYPDVKFYITGVKKNNIGRTNTQAYSSNEINKILEIGNVEDYYDIGLWNQLALIQKCDIFIAPHTGFAFLAPCVGTPWLAISRGDWHENLFNKIPFYSVLPDVRDYPRYARERFLGLEELKVKNGEKIPEMMPEKFEKKFNEIIYGIRLLLDKDFTYKKAINLHKNKIRKSKTIKQAYTSFDNVLGLDHFGL